MAKKIKKYKVGIDSETYAISMVEAPAIESDFVHLEEQKEEKVFLQAEEKYMVYGAALIPDKDIYRNNGEQEFYISFTKESIEKMSQEFMKDYRQNEITIDHQTNASDITVVESWLKSDMIHDKSVALGLDITLPIGTWFVGMKVNQIDVWERIKNGELKGFSVESMISLEEFEKQNKEDMLETNETFWSRLKTLLSEVLQSTQMSRQEELTTELSNEEIKEELSKYGIEAEFLEDAVEEPTEAPTEPTPTETPTEEETTSEEPQNEPTEAPNEEDVKEEDSTPQLQELVNSLKAEIEALKKMNSSLEEKVTDLGRKPSAEPVNVNAKPSASDSYSSWREQMRKMIG